MTKTELMLSGSILHFAVGIEAPADLRRKITHVLCEALRETCERDTLARWSLREGLYLEAAPDDKPDDHHTLYPRTLYSIAQSTDGYRVGLAVGGNRDEAPHICVAMSQRDLQPFFDACDATGLPELLLSKQRREAASRLTLLAQALDWSAEA